jgi:putative ABC transport system permease protein
VNLTRKPADVSIVSGACVTPPRRAARQRSLIRWQVAISACFFTIAAVLAKAVITEARNDSGIALERLALTTLHFGAQGWDEARARRAIDRTLSVARARSEIRSVSVSTGLPFGFQMTSAGEVTTTDRPFVANLRANWAILLAGSPDLLRTLDVPLLRGRSFTEADDAGAPRVAIVSELTEKRLFGTASAIDRQILIRDRERKTIDTVSIVGVAKPTDVDALMQRRGDLIYLPFAQRYRANVVLVANASGEVAAALRALQSSIREADPDLAAGTSGPAYWLTAGPYVAARIAAGFASALGLLTLILAMIGLYGVLTQAVANRTREVGVRMALGAGARDIERMVLRQGTGPVLQGVVVGLLLGTVARGLIRALLAAPVQIVDPFTLIAVPVPLAVAALIACYLPARRAAQVDPNVALRHL